MTDWGFISATRAGVALADLAPYLREREIVFRLGKPPTASGTMNINAPRCSMDILQPGVHELQVWRDGTQQDALLRLVKATPTGGRVGGSVKFEWEGIETYLRGLLIPAATVESAAQSLHAWNRISAGMSLTGASVFNITRGLVPSTDPVKARTYTEPMDILTAIEDLSGRDDGFDFAFNKDREFDCYYPYRGSDTGLVFEYAKNILGYSFDIDAGPGAIATDVLAKGSAASATATSATGQATYGRVDAFQPIPDNAGATGVIQGYADATLATIGEPLFVPTITIDATHPDNPWGSYWLGDTVTVRIKAGDGSYVNIDGQYRITAISVKINDLGSESISLELNSVLPMVIDRALLQHKAATDPSASNSVVLPSMAERIAALERALV